MERSQRNLSSFPDEVPPESHLIDIDELLVNVSGSDGHDDPEYLVNDANNNNNNNNHKQQHQEEDAHFHRKPVTSSANNGSICLRKESSSSTTSSMSSSLSSYLNQHSDSSSFPSVAPSPPDGGWGWIVVLASFLCNVIVDGIIFSFGVLFPKILREFNTSKGTTAWIGSLQAGCYLVIGPVVAGLAGRYGCRTVTIVGSVIGALGFFLSFWADSVLFLYCSFGVIGGIGFGFIYLPAIVTVGHYFESKRAFATGIAVCGSGIGAFIMAPLVEALSEAYGWRGCILILSGLILTCAAFGSLFRPILDVPIMPKKETPLLHKEIKDSKERKKRRRLSHKKGTLKGLDDREWHAGYSGEENDGNKGGKDCKMHEFPTNQSNDEASETVRKSTIIKTLMTTTPGSTAASGVTTTTSIHSQNRSMPDLMHLFPSSQPDLIGQPGSQFRPRTLTESPVKPEVGVEGSIKSRSQVFSRNLQLFKKRNSTPSFIYDSLPKAELDDEPIPEEVEGKVVEESKQAEVKSQKQLEEERIAKKFYDIVSCDETSSCGSDSFLTSLSSDLKNILDPDLLASPSFLLLALSGFLTLAGFFIPFMYIVDRAVLQGVTQENAAYLLSLIGITNTVGRVFCGWISDHPRVNALMINNAALVVGGGITFLSPIICNNFASLAVYGCVFGFSIACFATLRSVIIVDLQGLEKLTPAFGLLLLPQGIATIVGSPIAGWLYDVSGSYDSSFYVAGAVVTISGLMCFPLKRISEWEKKRKCQEHDTP